LQEYKIIKSILLDIIDEDFIVYDEEENSFITPFCMIKEFDDIWYISFDLSFNTDARSLIFCTKFIRDLMNHQIMVEIDTAFYKIMKENSNEVIDILWDSDIYNFMDTNNNELQYEEAKEILIKQIKEDNKNIKEIKNNSKEIH
jgi:hypothetical protein